MSCHSFPSLEIEISKKTFPCQLSFYFRPSVFPTAPSALCLCVTGFRQSLFSGTVIKSRRNLKGNENETEKCHSQFCKIRRSARAGGVMGGPPVRYRQP